MVTVWIALLIMGVGAIDDFELFSSTGKGAIQGESLSPTQMSYLIALLAMGMKYTPKVAGLVHVFFD